MGSTPTTWQRCSTPKASPSGPGTIARWRGCVAWASWAPRARRSRSSIHLRKSHSSGPRSPGCARRSREDFPWSTWGPRDAFVSPRFGQIATFMLLPAVPSAGDLDIALLGIPYDGGTSYRTGARFGPRAVREQSSLIRPWNPVLKRSEEHTSELQSHHDLV